MERGGQLTTTTDVDNWPGDVVRFARLVTDGSEFNVEKYLYELVG
jgi:thioredoxin reductase